MENEDQRQSPNSTEKSPNPTKKSPNSIKKLKSKKFIIIAGLSGLGLVAFLMFILAVTAFKAKDPIAMVDGVTVRSLNTSQNVPIVIVDLSLSVKNPSKAVFKSNKAIAYLAYRGLRIGVTEFEVGKIAPGATKTMAITLTSMPERLQGNPEIGWELNTGKLPLNTETIISGKVFVFRMVKVHVVGTQLCGFLINVKEKTVMVAKCFF